MASNVVGFDDEINRLAEEGKRLGSLPISKKTKTPTQRSKSLWSGQQSSKVMGQLENLRKEIEVQNQQTLNLEKEIKQTAKQQDIANTTFLNRNINNSNNYSNNEMLYNGPPGDYTPRMSINQTGVFSSLLNQESQRISASTMHLEKALEDSQMQVDYLTKKLRDVHEMAAKQKDQFRGAVEELQLKLQETVSGRKRLMEMRESEMAQQEDMIHRLQVTIEELATSNQMQDQALFDANEQMEILHKKEQLNNRAMEQIRTILTAQDRIRGRTSRFLDSGRLSELSPDLLVDSLDRFIADCQEENNDLRNKILQLEAKIRANDETHKAQSNLIVAEHNQEINDFKTEFNDQMDEKRRQCEEAEFQIKNLREKLRESENTAQMKSEELRQRTTEMATLKIQFDELKDQYLTDKDVLQTKLEEVGSERNDLREKYSICKSERDDLKKRLGEAQNSFLRTNEELKSEQEQESDLRVKLSDVVTENNQIRHQLEERSGEVSRLREMNSDLRTEFATKVADEVRRTEIAERSKGEEKISKLSNELSRTREELCRVQGTLEATEKQISDVMLEKSKYTSSLNDKEQQIEQLKSQCSLMELKLTEINESRQSAESKLYKLKSDHDEVVHHSEVSESEMKKLKKLLDEKEQSTDHYRRRVDSLTADVRSYAKELERLKTENNELTAQVKKHAGDVDHLNKLLTTKDSTIGDYEARISDLLQEKCTLENERREFALESEKYSKRNKKIESEIKSANTQISILIEERESLKSKLLNVEESCCREATRLKKQLKQTQRNLQQAEESLQTIKSVDGRAAKVAEAMQKEVTDKRSVIDSLKSELNKAYDKYDLREKEHSLCKDEISRLKVQVKQLSDSKQELAEKLRTLAKTEKGYKLAVERLQKGLEHAANRNIDAQAVIQQQEQAIAQSHITRNIPKNVKPMLGEKPADNNPMVPQATQLAGLTAQSILARMFTNIPTQNKHSVPASHSAAVEEKTIDVKPVISTDASASDIYKILSEVRDHLINRSKENIPRQSREKRKMKKRIKDDTTINDSDLPVVTINSDVISTYSLSAIKEQSTLLPDETEQSVSVINGPLMTSSPCKPLRSTTKNSKSPPSPVSSLLGVNKNDSVNEKTLKKILQQSMDNNSNCASEKDTNTSDLLAINPNKVVTVISDTTDDLCKQLQCRLEDLTKLGGKLQRQNKATDNMIKKQDKGLKKVRETASKLR